MRGPSSPAFNRFAASSRLAPESEVCSEEALADHSPEPIPAADVVRYRHSVQQRQLSWAVRSAQAFADLAVLAAIASMVCIWWARILTPSVAYVSEMGAPGMPHAALLNFSLMLLAVASFLLERALGKQPGTIVTTTHAVGALLLVSGLMFAIASTVTCTMGCPAPFTPKSTVQDLLHIAAATTGFVTALLAMIVVARISPQPALRAFSVIALLAVAGTAATGAMLSVLQLDTHLGGWMEFLATTVAIAWFVGFGFFVRATSSPSGSVRVGGDGVVLKRADPVLRERRANCMPRGRSHQRR